MLGLILRQIAEGLGTCRAECRSSVLTRLRLLAEPGLRLTSAPVLTAAMQICLRALMGRFLLSTLAPSRPGIFIAHALASPRCNTPKKAIRWVAYQTDRGRGPKPEWGRGGRVARVVFNLPPSQSRTVAGRDCSAPLLLWGAPISAGVADLSTCS
jgi:hypothetical protein